MTSSAASRASPRHPISSRCRRCKARSCRSSCRRSPPASPRRRRSPPAARWCRSGRPRPRLLGAAILAVAMSTQGPNSVFAAQLDGGFVRTLPYHFARREGGDRGAAACRRGRALGAPRRHRRRDQRSATRPRRAGAHADARPGALRAAPRAALHERRGPRRGADRRSLRATSTSRAWPKGCRK